MGTETNGTKQRLLAAAGTLFAGRGFAATTMREIAERAGVNLAAANYHFGSKKDLYVAVLRDQFALIRGELERRGGMPPPAVRRHLSRSDLEAILAARCRILLEFVLGPPPSLHGALMQREFTDPTEALPVVLDEFVRPMFAEMAVIVAQMEPSLSPEAVQRSTFSCVAQVVFYRFAMPAVLGVLGTSAYPPDFVARTAEHISAFCLGGLARVSRQDGAARKGRTASSRRDRARKQVSHAAQS